MQRQPSFHLRNVVPYFGWPETQTNLNYSSYRFGLVDFCNGSSWKGWFFVCAGTFPDDQVHQPQQQQQQPSPQYYQKYSSFIGYEPILQIQQQQQQQQQQHQQNFPQGNEIVKFLQPHLIQVTSPSGSVSEREYSNGKIISNIALKNEDDALKQKEAQKTNEKLKELENRIRCGICMEKDRDSLIMPCMHFLYCHGCLAQHQQTSKFCPACRTSISGVLQSKLG